MTYSLQYRCFLFGDGKTKKLKKYIKNIIIQCGTNNIDSTTTTDIVNGLLCIAISIAKTNKQSTIHITGLIPRDFNITPRRNKINEINDLLKHQCKRLPFTNILFIKQL